MLVAVVLATVLDDFGTGVMWAFVAGLTANLLTDDPLGSVPLGQLLVSALTAGGARVFGRLALAYPILAVVIGSVVVDFIAIGVMQLVDPPLVGGPPLGRILGAALLNGLLAAVAIVPARSLVSRLRREAKPTW